MNSFGKRLKKLRLEKELTQEDLGKIVNTSGMAISNWEKGSRTPDQDNLVTLANYFDVTLDYLLCRTDNKNNSVIEGNLNDKIVTIEIEGQEVDLTKDEIQELIDKLANVGFDVNKLLK